MPATSTPTKQAPLKDCVMALLSLASLRGRKKIDLQDLFRALSVVIEKHPELFPPVIFEKTLGGPYSRNVDYAISSLIPYSVESDIHDCVTVSKETAGRHLAYLRGRHGDDFVRAMEGLADEFITALRRKWIKEEIIRDLKEIRARGGEPDPYELKEKYGYELLSEFFPLLESIRTTRWLGLGWFVGEIFRRVTDPRDLNFIFGSCSCEACRED